MNRIILVGNGFDLAHGLKTSYNDFLKGYWANWLTELRKCSQHNKDDGLCRFSVRKDLNHYTLGVISSARKDIETLEDIFLLMSKGLFKDIQFVARPLFNRIKETSQKYNWVDIEKEYYRILTDVSLGEKPLYEKGSLVTVGSINAEMDNIQSEMIGYLAKIKSEKIDDSILHNPIKECMMAPFCAKEIAIDAREKWYDFLTRRYNYEHLKSIIQRYEDSDVAKIVAQVDDFKQEYGGQIEYNGIDSISGEKLPTGMLYPDRVMLLNFNYTNTADMYMPEDEYVFPINHIHGDLSNPNSVIFGYGDELDEKYQEIRNLNNNELLKNMKSIRYLEDVNYRNLLTFIESAPYQVYIMGHSCGVSDRTLLNTLFEHPNCVSIKPFYYVNEQGQDNYIEIVQNISRNFNDPKKMRDRVVNKTYCLPLPQCPKTKE